MGHCAQSMWRKSGSPGGGVHVVAKFDKFVKCSHGSIDATGFVRLESGQWWRDLAAQVAPQWQRKTMMTIIVDALPVFYYEKMVGYTPSKLCGFGLWQWKDRCGSEKRQI